MIGRFEKVAQFGAATAGCKMRMGRLSRGTSITEDSAFGFDAGVELCQTALNKKVLRLGGQSNRNSAVWQTQPNPSNPAGNEVGPGRGRGDGTVTPISG